MRQEEIYNFFFNVEGNRTMYKKFKVKTQTELLCLFLQITFFTFKGHNLLISSLISILFVPLDALCGELQNLLEA